MINQEGENRIEKLGSSDESRINSVIAPIDAKLVEDLTLLEPKIKLPQAGEFLDKYHEHEKVKQDLRDYLKNQNTNPNYLPSIHSDPIIDHDRGLVVCTDTHEVGFYTYKDGKLTPIDTGCSLLPNERLWSVNRQGPKYFVRKATYNQNHRRDDSKDALIIFDENGHKQREVGKNESIWYRNDQSVYLGEKTIVDERTKRSNKKTTVYDNNLHPIVSDIDNDIYAVRGVEGHSVILLIRGFGSKYAIADASGVVQEKDMNTEQQTILNQYKQKQEQSKLQSQIALHQQKRRKNYEYKTNADGNVVISNNAGKELFVGGGLSYLKKDPKYTVDTSDVLLFAHPTDENRYYKLEKYSSNDSAFLYIKEHDLTKKSIISTHIINKNTGEKISFIGEYTFVNKSTIKNFINNHDADLYNADFELLGRVIHQDPNIHSVVSIQKGNNGAQFVSTKSGSLVGPEFTKIKKRYNQNSEYDVFIVSDRDGQDQEVIVEK